MSVLVDRALHNQWEEGVLGNGHVLVLLDDNVLGLGANGVDAAA